MKAKLGFAVSGGVGSDVTELIGPSDGLKVGALVNLTVGK